MLARFLTDADALAHEKTASHSFVFKTDLNGITSLPSPVMAGVFTDDGEMMADAEILEKQAFFYGKKLRCAAIGGVCSMPAYRNSGAVRKLFDFIEKSGRYDIAVLYPFSMTFYSKLGFGSCGRMLTAEFPFSCFYHLLRSSSVRLYEGGNPAEPAAVYNSFAEKYNLCLERTESTQGVFVTSPFSEQKYNYVWYGHDGAPAALCKIAPDREKSTLFVSELFYDTPAALRGILGFLRCFEGNYEKICFEKLPEDSPVPSLANDITKAVMTLREHTAVKILNIPAALTAAGYTRDGSFSVGIDGEKYLVSITGGKAVCEPFEGYPDVTFSAPDFSSALAQGVSEREKLLYMQDFRENKQDTDFYGILKPRTAFICDEF